MFESDAKYKKKKTNPTLITIELTRKLGSMSTGAGAAYLPKLLGVSVLRWPHIKAGAK